MVALYDTTRRFLFAQRKPYIPMVIQIFTTILHFGWCYLYIIKLDLGMIGSGLAMTTTYSINFILVQGYAWMQEDLEEYWAPFFTEETFNFDGIYTYFSLALPSYIMLSLPQWALELCSFMAGEISVLAMSAQATLYNCSVIFLQVPMGFMYSSSTFVGNNVGKGFKELAKYYARLTFIMAGVLMLFIVAFQNTFAHEIALIYTSNVETIPIIENAIFYLSINSFFQGLAATLSGVMRGVGQQRVGLYNALVGNYLFGIPLAYYFCFVQGMMVNGLWLGCSIGVCAADCAHVFYLT